jgi:hypothetical protein
MTKILGNVRLDDAVSKHIDSSLFRKSPNVARQAAQHLWYGALFIAGRRNLLVVRSVAAWELRGA